MSRLYSYPDYCTACGGATRGMATIREYDAATGEPTKISYRTICDCYQTAIPGSKKHPAVDNRLRDTAVAVIVGTILVVLTFIFLFGPR
jgi:hypothetical protein